MRHEPKPDKNQPKREVWDVPVLGLEPWFEHLVWSIYPRKDGRELALQEIERVFDRIPDVVAKKKFAYKFVMSLRFAVRLWDGLDPSVLEPLHAWVRNRGWENANPTFANLCTQAMAAQAETRCESVALASFFRPFLGHPEIGQACREMVAMLEHDFEAERWEH